MSGCDLFYREQPIKFKRLLLVRYKGQDLVCGSLSTPCVQIDSVDDLLHPGK